MLDIYNLPPPSLLKSYWKIPPFSLQVVTEKSLHSPYKLSLKNRSSLTQVVIWKIPPFSLQVVTEKSLISHTISHLKNPSSLPTNCHWKIPPLSHKLSSEKFLLFPYKLSSEKSFLSPYKLSLKNPSYLTQVVISKIPPLSLQVVNLSPKSDKNLPTYYVFLLNVKEGRLGDIFLNTGWCSAPRPLQTQTCSKTW